MDLQSNVLTITKVQNGSSGAPGRDGANGYNAATLYIYQRSANGAPAAPSNTLTYNFVSGTFTSGSLGNWSQQISEGTDPCYVAVAAAISNSTTNEDYIESSDWTVRELVRNGEDGSDGQDGAPGYNQATIYLYQRTASTAIPSKPTGLTYKFSTGVISGNLGNWQQTIPDGTNPCYITSAVVISTQDENNPLNFSTPVKLVENGASGASYATVYLYKRGTSTPAKPNGNVTYIFEDGTVSGSLNGWTKQIPSGTDPCYMIVAQATASAGETQDIISSSEWSTQTKIVENGTDGAPGAPGLNQATIYLYKRIASGGSTTGPTNAITYTFTDASVSPTTSNGWTQQIPASNGNPCYVVSAAAISNSSSISIPTTSWSSAVKLVEDGENGQDGQDGNNFIILSYYKRFSSLPTKPSGTYSYNFSTQTFSGGHTVEGWTDTIPESNSNHDPCYVSTIIFLGNTTTVSGKAFSDPIKLVEDGKDANSLRAVTSVEQVLRFADSIDENDNQKVIYSIAPESINILAQYNDDSLSTTDFTVDISLNDIRLQDIIKESKISDYIVDTENHAYYSFLIDKLNDDKENDEIIKANTDEEIKNNKDFLVNFFTNTRALNYFAIKILYQEEVAYKYLIFSTGTNEDAARLSVKACGIYASIANAGLVFDNDGLTITNGNIRVKDSNSTEVLYFDNNTGNLVIIGDIYADNGVFRGEVHATSGDFTGSITALEGTIGGFNITSNTIETTGLILSSGGGDEGSKIQVENIILGSGAKIGSGGKIAIGENLVISDPTSVNNNTVFALTRNNNNYFSINNDGDINGYNWSIKNNDNEIVATFDRLVTTNGNFKGHIEASDITAGTISASAIETASFVTEKIRSMGGAFIFRPVSNIASNGISNYNTTNKQIKIILDQPNFVNNYAKVGDTIIISGNLNSNNNAQDNINSQNLTGGSNYYAIIDIIDVDDNFIIVTPINPNHYSTILAQTNLQDENALVSITVLGQNDILIGINSDGIPAGNILPQRGLVMEAFKHSLDSGRHYFDYDVKLFLGDFQALADKNLIPNSAEFNDGWGLYSDNVYLKGSLVTEQVQSGSNNFTFAGVSTRTNATVKVEDEDERIMFWAGAQNVNDISNSPFIVTENGTIFAKQGVFEGSVISKALITQSTIRTPSLYGTGNSPSLKILNTHDDYGGISFYSTELNIKDYNGEIPANQMHETLRLKDSGFSRIQNDSTVFEFIKFIKETNTESIEFNGNKFDAGNCWELTNEGIAYKNNLRITTDDDRILRIGTSTTNRIYFDDGIDLQTNNIIRNKGTVQFYNDRINTTISLEYSIRDSRYCLFVQEGE